MVNTLSRCLRGCALVMVAVLLGACSRVIAGTVQPVGSVADKPPVPIADLVVEPDQFPPRYPAAVLDDAALDRAVADIDAVPAGAVVTPADCTPPVLWHSETAGVEGVDSDTASRLVVVVTRPAPPLSERLDQLRRCSSFTVGGGEEESMVSLTVLPAPPVDADDAYAVEQMVTTPESERTVLTFAAQIGETRVSASWLQDPAVDEPDTAALDRLFSDAVVKLRRDG
ncbi:hypothetical protein [Mycobacterium barrassiae]|uniref:hypothetical protein n=1 Tax=Mycobacterium barrassiae TaxID=319709 RepID=UPI002265DE95|nr:hypothetical protein [Mycobacterium barrassiae]